MVLPTHRKIADNQTNKDDGFNSRLTDLDTMVGGVLDLSIDYTNSYTLNNKEFYQNTVFRIDDAGGADGDITITVPSTKRPMFAVVNDTAQNIYVKVSGQIQEIYITTLGYFLYDQSDMVVTPHGTRVPSYSLVVDQMSATSALNTITFTFAEYTLALSTLSATGVFGAMLFSYKLTFNALSATGTLNNIALSYNPGDSILEGFESFTGGLPDTLNWTDDSIGSPTISQSTSNSTEGTHSIRFQSAGGNVDVDLNYGMYLEAESIDGSGFNYIKIDYTVVTLENNVGIVGFYVYDNWKAGGEIDYQEVQTTGSGTFSIDISGWVDPSGIAIELNINNTSQAYDVYFDNLRLTIA